MTATNGSIIPTSIPVFNVWIVQTNLRQLATNPATTNPWWTDYGWTSAQSTAYTTDWRDEWVNNIYPLHTNPATNTEAQKKLTVEFIEDFIEWMQDEQLLDKIKSCGLADTFDEATWGVDLERDPGTKLQAKIEGIPVAKVTGLVNGDFDIKIFAGDEDARASIDREAGADSVQHAWKVMDTKNSIVPPTDASLQKDISKKAHYPFAAGAENQAKFLLIYFRWYNTSYPQYAGTWSPPVIVVIP